MKKQKNTPAAGAHEPSMVGAHARAQFANLMIRVPIDVAARLREIARAEERSIAAIARRFIIAGIREYKGQQLSFAVAKGDEA